MVIVVCGAAEWPKTRAALDYFHERHRFTALVGKLGTAQRWALERGIRFTQDDPLKAIDRRPQRLLAFPGSGVLVDMARSRGIKVIEAV